MITTNFAAIILAGGENLRLPYLKAKLLMGGEILIKRITLSLLSLFDDILIVVDEDKFDYLGKLMYRFGNSVKLVSDVVGPKCPLRGLYSGLLSSPARFNFLVGCDMPFLQTGLIDYMARRVSRADVVIPRIGKFLEPLHAFYSSRCIPGVEKVLKEGRKKMVSFLPYVKVEYLDEEEIAIFDSQGISFFNINTIDDWKKAMEIERKRREQLYEREYSQVANIT
ncbi:NTP transferase domain-containing protein [bacterium]|nr:NTP transferase domain-containing protein [bacterium]NIN92614.1 NTP transferase domain-containing protein [bacterium]NIO18639.1 NTP transferase domain-containing protein [bacterium]NIO73661.1 NTP transferase domain-containing protein [bacterium]